MSDKKLDKDLLALEILRKQAKEIGVQADALQARVIVRFNELELTNYSVNSPDGRTISATKVTATKTVINEAGLKKTLGAKLWEKVTTVSLDKKKLEAFIASGEIDATKVAQNSEVFNNEPFVKISVK